MRRVVVGRPIVNELHDDVRVQQGETEHQERDWPGGAKKIGGKGTRPGRLVNLLGGGNRILHQRRLRHIQDCFRHALSRKALIILLVQFLKSSSDAR